MDKIFNDTQMGENFLREWREMEKKALELLQIVGELRFDRSIELVLFRRDIYDSRPSELLQIHALSKHYHDKDPLNIDHTLAIARAIYRQKNMVPSRIDLGTIGVEWLTENKNESVNEFVVSKLGHLVESEEKKLIHKDVILYGFGRIGRIAARRLVQQTGRGEQLRLRAIVIRPQMKNKLEEAEKRAALLRTDSVHGEFRGTVEVAAEGHALLINGNHVHLIYASAPSEVDYTQYDIHDAIVIDNTGVWRDRASLEQHLRPGASHVILTSPGKDIPNIVYGANHESIDPEENILCAASCTTNAIVPVIKAIDDKFAIQKGHIETIHSYTSDQNLLDNFHKKPRRGRAAAINMVITSTGAGEAVSKVMPHLVGKLTGNAVRVPTPNVSLAILNLTLDASVTKEEVNLAVKDAAMHGSLVEQIQYSTSDEYVSSHAVGATAATVFDSPSTLVSKDGHSTTLYTWYDNEYGYTCQVIRLAKWIAKVRRAHYY